MATKNKYQRQKQQYSNDGGQTWFDVVPANYRKGSLIEEASEDCNTTQWVEVQNAWYCIGDSVDIQYRWVNIEQTMCNGYDKYSMQKQQQSTDGGVTWTDTGNTRQGTLIETDSADCGYKPDYENQYLTMEALDNATIEVYPQYTDSKLYYKIDNEGWKEYNNSDTITLNSSSKIMFKETLTSSRLNATRFKCLSGYINVYGNVMSLVYGDDFIGKTTMSNFKLERVFSRSNIIDAGNLILPATTLARGCYEGMFSSCTSLLNAPELPATTLAENCYERMFFGCTSLTTAPVLPATTLAKYCYSNMFADCTSLNNINCQLTNVDNTATQGWVNNVRTNSGTFTYNCVNKSWTTGVNGIPENWSRQCE